MDDDLKNLRPTTANLVKAAEAEYEHVKANIPLPAGMDADIAAAVISENVIRRAIEACVNGSAGFGPNYCAELAARLASYAISIAPDSHHASMIAAVRDALPGCHAERMRLGVRIEAEWDTIPDRNSMN